MELAAPGSSEGFIAVGYIFYIAILVFILAGLWKTFAKTGQRGWTAIIPILNSVVLLKIVKRPLWWIILFFIPCVGFVVWIIVLNELSKAFGKRVGFTVGLFLLGFVFFPILGFGDAEYELEKDPLF